MSLVAQRIESMILSPEQYKALEKACGALANPMVNANTSELEAGQKLGVQYVLALCRNGWNRGT